MDDVGLKQRDVRTEATENSIESSSTESALGQSSSSSVLAVCVFM